MSNVTATEPAWIRRYRAARVSLPTWAEGAPSRTAYATNASGVWQAMSWDLAAGVHAQITDKATGVPGGVPTWDGSGVVWFDDDGGDEVGRFVVSPFGGGDPAPLAAAVPDGWSAGLSLRPERTAIGVSTREGCSIYVDGAQVYFSQNNAAVGGLSRDATLLAVSHTEHGDALHPSVKVVDPGSGEVLADLHDGKGMSLDPAGWSPVAGDGRLAILADRTGRFRPELWTPATGDRVPLQLDLPGEVTVADWYPDGQAVLLAHDHFGRTSLLRYDLAAHAATPIELGDGTIRAARVRPDRTLWYAFTSAAEPAQVRALRPDGTDEVLLRPPGEPAPRGVPYTSITYQSEPGVEVHSFLATPAGDGPFPLVVEAHGGPHAHVEDTFFPLAQAWVDHGFAVLQPNYRGSTGYGKAWEDALVGDPGRPELVDLRAGRDHLVATGVADPQRCVLAGASWGGYLTLQGVGTQPESWAAGCAGVPVADYPAAFEDESPLLQEFDRSLFGGTPEELPQLYRERSPLTYVAAVRAPVLIVTGENDTRCPKRQVDNYVAALVARGHPHQYEVYDAGHGSLAVEIQVWETKLQLDFAAQHLGTTPAITLDDGSGTAVS